MSKEKEIQDELERYWGQLDRVERMLKWLIVQRLDDQEHFYSADRKTYHYSKFKDALPDISDIWEEKE